MSKKTLINEVLPSPSPAPGRSLRDRVKRHAQKVLASGAIASTSMLADCADTGTNTTADAGTDAGYTVVDPLPPPCTNYDPAVGATGSATIDTQDGLVQVRVLTLSNYPWRFDDTLITNVVGATLVGTPTSGSSQNEFMADFTPAANGTVFLFQAGLTCNDYRRGGPVTQALLVQVTLSAPLTSSDGGMPEDAGTVTAEVVVSKIETDGGP